MSMKRQTLRLTIAASVGAASDFLPIPGLLGAALVFPQGVEGDHGFAYLALALCLNFALFFGIAYFIFGLYTKMKNSN
jgi:predicted permease